MVAIFFVMVYDADDESEDGGCCDGGNTAGCSRGIDRGHYEGDSHIVDDADDDDDDDDDGEHDTNNAAADAYNVYNQAKDEDEGSTSDYAKCNLLLMSLILHWW